MVFAFHIITVVNSYIESIAIKPVFSFFISFLTMDMQRLITLIGIKKKRQLLMNKTVGISFLDCFNYYSKVACFTPECYNSFCVLG